MSWFVDCANCRRQVLIDGPESTCYFCGKSATKKEDIMQEKQGTVKERVVPPRPTKRKKVWEYFEQNKEDMLADYQSMRIIDFLKRWRLGPGIWLKLKNKWGILPKTKRTGPKPAKAANASPGEIGRSKDTKVLTEHEQYLIVLGYQMAVREILKIT